MSNTSSTVEAMAEKYANRKLFIPMSLLFQHFFINGDVLNARRVWERHLGMMDRKLPRTQIISRRAVDQKNPELAFNLIAFMEMAKMNKPDLGVLYGNWISILCDQQNYEKALEALGTALKTVRIDQIDRKLLKRLKIGAEANGRQFPHELDK